MNRLRAALPLLAVCFAGDIATALSGDIAGAIRFGVASLLLTICIARGVI